MMAGEDSPVVRSLPRHYGDMGSDAYRKEVAELPPDAQARVKALEALESSGGFRILKERAAEAKERAIEALAEVDPSAVSQVAAIQRFVSFSQMLDGAVMAAINDEIAVERKMRKADEHAARGITLRARAQAVEQFS